MFKELGYYSNDRDAVDRLKGFVDSFQQYFESKNPSFSIIRDTYYIYGGACYRAYHGYENEDVDIFFRDLNACKKFLELYITFIGDVDLNAPYLNIQINGVDFQIITFRGGLPENMFNHVDFLQSCAYFEDQLIKIHSKKAYDAFINEKLTLNKGRKISIHTLKRFIKKTDLIGKDVDVSVLKQIVRGVSKNPKPMKLVSSKETYWFDELRMTRKRCFFDEYNDYIPPKWSLKSMFENDSDFDNYTEYKFSKKIPSDFLFSKKVCEFDEYNEYDEKNKQDTDFRDYDDWQPIKKPERQDDAGDFQPYNDYENKEGVSSKKRLSGFVVTLIRDNIKGPFSIKNIKPEFDEYNDYNG